MNNRENALKLRVLKLEQANAALKLTYDRMLADIELTESAGCAYAWELAQTMVLWNTPPHRMAILTPDFLSCPPDLAKVNRNWELALEAGAAFQEAKKWLRDKLKTDAVWKKTAIEAAGKNPEMELETPFGRYSLRLLTST